MKQFLPLSVLIALPWLLQAAPASEGRKMAAAPLSFIENKGQVVGSNNQPRTDIDLKLEAPGVNIFIGDGQVHYMWRKAQGAIPMSIGTKSEPTDHKSQMFETYRMDVELVGANKNAEIIKEQQQAYFENYYLPQCLDGATAHSYGKVTYKNIYPNIDWVLYASNNELKYDFVVRPGGKASDIKLRYKGATALHMKDGAVTARTPFGSVTEKKPYSYDAVTKKELPSSFVLKNNELRFTVAPSENTIVIDPVLAWGSYYGEAGQDDYGEAVVTDANGNVFMSGYTYSDDEITDPFAPAHQHNLNGLIDAFIVKFDKDGTRLWATYYGGPGNEFCYDILANKAGEVYICGTTDSDMGLGFPGWVHKTSNLGGGTDAFVARFNATGQLIWSTFYGGTADETGEKIAIDGFGEVYLTGRTRSNSGIYVAPGFKSVYGGGFSDGYVAKFNTSGMVAWATYLGGMLDDVGQGITVDSNDYVFVAGETGSADFYCTPDAELDTLIIHPECPPPPALPCPVLDFNNMFIVKFSPPGMLLYSSMYEGWDTLTGNSKVYDITADSKGNIYIANNKLVKFDNNGKYQWFTGKTGYTLGVDNEDNIYTAGMTTAIGYATPGSYQPNPAGGLEGYILKYDATGAKTWGTYYGGVNHDYIKGLTFDKRNKMFVCGNTTSPGGITTPGSHKDTWSGTTFTTTDAFISKWHDTIAAIDPFIDTLACPPDTITVPYTVEVIFGATNTFYLELSDANGSFANPTVIGSWPSNNSGVIKGVIPANATPGNGYRVRIVSSSPAYTTPDNGRNIRILEVPKPKITGRLEACTNDSLTLTATNPNPSVLFTWSLPNGLAQTGPAVQMTNVSDVNAGHYLLTADNYGCSGRDSVYVLIHPRPYVTKLTHNGPVCDGAPLTMDVEGSMPEVIYQWIGPNGYKSSEKTPVINQASQSHAGLFYVFMQSIKGCVSDSNAVNIDVVKLEAHIKDIELRTPGDTIKFDATANRDDVTWSWEGPAGFISNIQNPLIEDIGVDQRGDYFVTVSKHGCTGKASIHVRVTEEITFTLFPSPNAGKFTIKGNTPTDQVINFEITDVMGKAIYRDQVKSFRKHFSKTIELPGVPAAGVYILRLDVPESNDVKFVIME